MKKRSASRLIPILSALGVLYLVFTGCGTRQASPLTDEMAARCVVVTDGRDSTGWSRWLDEHLGKSPRYPIDRIEEALSTSLKDDTILIIPGVTLESSHEEPLEDYIARGGRMLLLGANHPAIQLENPRIRQATGAGLGSYPVTSRVLRLDSRNEKIEIAPVQISCLFPPAPGSANDANPASWVRVWEAANAHGVAAGWAGSVLLIPQTDAGFSICGWLAFDPPPASDKPLESIVARMITETDRSAYLTRFGTGAFSFLEQKPVVAHAQMIDRRTRDFSPLRLAARWLDRNGQEIRRHISEPLDSPALRTELSVGVAPDVFGREPELFTLEWQIRDRNDLETLDAQSQIIKVFPKKNDSVKAEPVSVSGHTLVAGRRPVFMLGVNYWPRLSSRTAGLAGSGHWLHPARFDPGVLSSDLDLMTAAGINCIAIEYTDLSQAPQILFVLDELRKRSMRASIYMPSFHPFDLRREEGLAMLDAIDAGEWPEFFALEVARGIAVRSRADLRRLDTAWSEWLDQRFGSISEVEQKMGISVWREHGHIAGPPDAQLTAGPHQDRAIALYYSFLHDYASRQIGYVQRLLENKGYKELLITARSAYGWPDGKPDSVVDVLDIRAGAIHQDFLSPDAWTIHPLGQLDNDKTILAAYVAGSGQGKPVVWSGYGQHVGTGATTSDLERQKEVYLNFLNGFVEQNAAGAFAWWYPGGISAFHAEDWGMVEPQGVWRPVEEAIRSIRLQLRQSRSTHRASIKSEAPFNLSASQWNIRQEQRSGIFADTEKRDSVTEWVPPGHDLDTRAMMQPGAPRDWSEIDGLHLLNSEWGAVMVDNAAQDRRPGDNVRTYTDRLLMIELINSGTVTWTSGGAKREDGSVWVRITQPGHQEEWIPVLSAGHGSKQQLAWTPRAPGLWDVQAYLIGYGKFGERINVEVTTPPRLY